MKTRRRRVICLLFGLWKKELRGTSCRASLRSFVSEDFENGVKAKEPELQIPLVKVEGTSSTRGSGHALRGCGAGGRPSPEER